MANNQGTIDQYLGRTADYVAFQGIQAAGDVQLTQALASAGKGGAVVTGPQKVVQRFLLELLKEKGTMLLRPGGGTDFITEARLGYLRTATDVTGAFARAVIDVRATLSSEESEEDRDDERFKNAELLGVTVSGGKASLRIKVITRAETSREFIFPISVMV